MRTKDSFSTHDIFLAEVYFEVLKVSIAAYICLQTPEGTDPADFTTFLQEQFKLREAAKDKLFKVFQHQNTEREQFKEESTQMSEGSVDNEDQMETLMDIYTFKAEVLHRSGKTEPLRCTFSQIDDFITTAGNFFDSIRVQEHDVNVGSFEKIIRLNRITAEAKRFIHYSLEAAFNNFTLGPDKVQVAVRIWEVLSRILRLNYRQSYHAYVVSKNVLECFSKKLAASSEDLRRYLAPIILQRLVAMLLKEVEFDLHQAKLESYGHDPFMVNQNIVRHLWLLLNFLKYYDCLPCNINLVKSWCKQLDDLLPQLETETSTTHAKATGCQFLLFLLRFRFIRLTSNK